MTEKYWWWTPEDKIKKEPASNAGAPMRNVENTVERKVRDYNLPEQTGVFLQRLDHIAVYPTLNIRPTVEVHPQGGAEIFHAKILAVGKSKQVRNKTYKAEVNGRKVSLGGGTAVHYKKS